MSRITIREADLTRVTASNLGNEVVYVPGFATVDQRYINIATAADMGVPTLCSSIAEFEAYFGSIPAVFETAQAYPENFSSSSIPENGNMFEALSVDPSYVYARELIAAGIPVLYERVNTSDPESESYGADIKVSTLYSVLAGNTAGFNNLTDVGEYTVKYITSGGYPIFEYGDPGKNYQLSDPEINPVSSPMALQGPLLAANGSSNLRVSWDLNGKDVFIAENSPSTTTEYTFTYSAGAWQFAGSPVANMRQQYGLVVEGTPELNDTIVIQCVVTDKAIPTIVNRMLSVAAFRGDCVALIDHTNNPNRELDPINVNSIYYAIANPESAYRISSNGEYAAMFTPWCAFTFNNLSSAVADTSYGAIDYNTVNWVPAAMPGSYAYLLSLAYSVRTNASWLAIAGVSRGIVPNFSSLYTNKRMTNAIAESYQSETAISINPITNIRPYGFTIWGNRTLKDNAAVGGLTALSFLNIRNMVSDVKKQAYVAAKRCLFEQNTDILWLNFKSYLSPLLDQMTSGYGLSGYKVIRNASQDPSKILATIRLYPIYAVESFDITVELSNDSISVE